MKHPPGALNTIKSFTALAIHHSVYEEERVEWGFFLVRIRWGEKIVIRIRITIKIRMEKEGDGEDVDDARAALGRWKAGERTGVSLEELRSSSSCDSWQQQLRQRQLLMQEASWTENSTL